MDDKKYNGWTNYATWRVKLEIWDGDYYTGKDEAFDSLYEFSEWIKERTDEIVGEYGKIENHGKSSLAMDYARAFLDDVNWYEIAQSLADDNPLIVKK